MEMCRCEEEKHEKMRCFLEEKKVEFADRGTMYMVPMLDEMLQMDLKCVDDLQEFVVECKAERDRHERYSLKFQYYWAVLTYMTDLVEQFKRLNENQKGAVNEQAV